MDFLHLWDHCFPCKNTNTNTKTNTHVPPSYHSDQLPPSLRYCFSFLILPCSFFKISSEVTHLSHQICKKFQSNSSDQCKTVSLIVAEKEARPSNKCCFSLEFCRKTCYVSQWSVNHESNSKKWKQKASSQEFHPSMKTLPAASGGGTLRDQFFCLGVNTWQEYNTRMRQRYVNNTA